MQIMCVIKDTVTCTNSTTGAKKENIFLYFHRLTAMWELQALLSFDYTLPDTVMCIEITWECEK